jgi:hypothetical protein
MTAPIQSSCSPSFYRPSEAPPQGSAVVAAACYALDQRSHAFGRRSFCGVVTKVKQKVIYPYLSLQNIALLRSLSRQEKQLIDDEYPLAAPFAKLWDGLSKMIIRSENPYALASLVRLQANPEETKAIIVLAKQALLLTNDRCLRDRSLSEIISREAQVDLAAAQETVLRIEDLFYRAMALMEIAQQQMKTDAAAAQLTLERLKSPMNAPNNLSTSISTCTAIAKLEMQVNVEEGKRTLTRAKMQAGIIQDPPLHAALLIDIANVEASFDVETAKMTLEKAMIASHECEIPDSKSILLEYIVRLQAEIDLSAAIDTAAQIQDPYYKTLALLTIAKAQAKIDRERAKITLELAKEAIDSITFSFKKGARLVEMASKQMNIYLDEVKRSNQLTKYILTNEDILESKQIKYLALLFRLEVKLDKVEALKTLNLLQTRIGAIKDPLQLVPIMEILHKVL